MNSLFHPGRLVVLAACALCTATMAQEPQPALTGRAIAELLPPHTEQIPVGSQVELVPAPGGYYPQVAEVAPGTLDRLHGGILRSDLKINAAQSCAAASCHGGPRPGVKQPQVRRGDEFQLWFENDPHARSWRTLCSNESAEIMRQLKIIDDGRIVDPAGYDNCLACHNSTQRYGSRASSTSSGVETPAQHDGKIVNSFVREGVSCSNCHGPDELWRGTHYQYDWSPSAAVNDGFIDAGDLYVRARTCAACHVGDRDRDMNHDMIAAGHPPLRYELATYHASLPKHWRDAEAGDATHYEAQLWLAGQVAATDASLALLQARALKSNAVSQWPEFSAYDCASCHHALGLRTNTDSGSPSRNPIASYSRWNDAGLRWLIEHRSQTDEATDEDFSLLAALDAVKQTMEANTNPNASSVAMETSQARVMLAHWFDGLPGLSERQQFRSDRLGRVVAAAAGKQETFQTWESAVQFYLAAVAARESWPGGRHGTTNNSAIQLRNGLRYPDLLDISNYKEPGPASLTTNRISVMRSGIELAGTLGPVALESMVEGDAENDSEGLRQQIKRMIDELDERWRDGAD